MTNQRYSTLSQIDKTNVNYLKGAWMTRLSRSGFGRKYSAEATPLVKDGIMYMVTGNDDVFALSAKTGEILWKRWSLIDQKISTVCCGWDNRGLAMGEGMLFLGQLDANVVALDIQTGREVWRTPIDDWHNGYSITSAPLYYDGIVYSGISGGELGIRGRLTALDAKTGKILWRAYTVPDPGEAGSDTWPAPAKGRSLAGLQFGIRRRSTRNSGSSTSRPAIARLTMMGPSAQATICSVRRSWHCRPKLENMSGISRKYITTSGTTTQRARSCSSTP